MCRSGIFQFLAWKARILNKFFRARSLSPNRRLARFHFSDDLYCLSQFILVLSVLFSGMNIKQHSIPTPKKPIHPFSKSTPSSSGVRKRRCLRSGSWSAKDYQPPWSASGDGIMNHTKPFSDQKTLFAHNTLSRRWRRGIAIVFLWGRGSLRDLSLTRLHTRREF